MNHPQYLRLNAPVTAAMVLLVLNWASLAMAIGPAPQAPTTPTTPAFDRAEPAPQITLSATVTEKLDQRIPQDITLTNEQGEKVQLSQFFKGNKPVLINLGYYGCPMLCGLVINGLTASLKDLTWTPGQEFEVLTVSIDPTESHKLAAAKKTNVLNELDRPGAGSGWHFLTGEDAQVRRLADAVGFGYAWDDVQKQYAHAAVLVIATPDGRVSRYLYGIQYPAKTLRLSLVEASEGKVGSTMDRVMLLCFHFDPKSGQYNVAAANLMRAGGALTILLVGGWIARSLYKEMRQRRNPSSSQPPEPPATPEA